MLIAAKLSLVIDDAKQFFSDDRIFIELFCFYLLFEGGAPFIRCIQIITLLNDFLRSFRSLLWLALPLS